MEQINNLIKLITNSTESVFYLKFETKIAYGNKHSIVYFLSKNIFDVTPVLITKTEFDSLGLKKVIVDIKDNSISDYVSTSSSGIVLKNYDNPIIELIKAVNNLKEITKHQQNYINQIK